MFFFLISSLVSIILVGVILFFERKVIAISQKRLSVSFLGRNGWIHVVGDLFKFWFKTSNKNTNFKGFSLLTMLGSFLIWNLFSIIFFLNFNFNSFFINQEFQILFYVMYVSITNFYTFILLTSLKSKYSVLAGLRIAVLTIFFEVPFTLLLTYFYFILGNYNFSSFVNFEGKIFLTSPFLVTIFLIYILFESKRAPFDHTEAESELVAGHLIEFGGRALFIFFICEYIHFFFIIFFIYIVLFNNNLSIFYYILNLYIV